MKDADYIKFLERLLKNIGEVHYGAPEMTDEEVSCELRKLHDEVVRRAGKTCNSGEGSGEDGLSGFQRREYDKRRIGGNAK